MKQSLSRRLFSVVLAMVMLFTSCPMAFGAETEPVAVEQLEETAVPEQTQTETEETETTEQPTEPAATEEPLAQETEAAQETVPEETGEETVPEETLEETVPEETAEETVPEETAEETIPEETTEETEPAEQPGGLTGMPEDYVLSEEALEKKQAMLDNGVLEKLAELIPGEDYVQNQLLASAGTQEEAELIAAAFNGTLTEFSMELAVIEVTEVTVLDAVTASLDMTRNLPAVAPNYISRVEPIVPVEKELMLNVPEKQTWQTWVQENMTNPDTYLKYPNKSEYQWMHDAVGTYAAWGVTTGESWVKVGVVDSGVQADHPDLKGRVTEVDVGRGTGDPIGHGTHVAGIIAASMDNGVGGAGIAPGVSIRSYRCAYDDGTIDSAALIRGIKQATADKVHILNISIGGVIYDYEESKAIRSAINAGVTVVAAMGNSGSNTMDYPAAYAGVIGVAATDKSNTRAYYSSYGPWVDVAAPGDNIMSTYIDSQYISYSGTSMAAPVVAGIAALYTSAMGARVAPAEMEKALEGAATKISDTGMGAGLVSAEELFGGKPDAPFLYVTDQAYEYLYDTAVAVPCESVIWFAESEITEWGGKPSGDQGDAIVITVDGKNPSVKNGEIVNGMLVEDGDGYYLRGFAGSTVTIKAARISGEGVMGKVTTLKVTVAKSTNVSKVVINGPELMVAGKTITLAAEVIPTDADYPVDQSVTWSIVNRTSNMSAAKIDQNGKLTTPAGQSGALIVRATSKAKPSVYADIYIETHVFTPFAKIQLSQTNTFTFVGEGGQLKVEKVINKEGRNVVDWYIVGVTWKSSNPKVATVDQDGNIVGVSKGTATITCTSLDGSGVSAKCKVEVRQPVEDIAVSGNWSIAPGASATYKATVYPSNANIKKVRWALSGNTSGISISSSGKVTVASWVTTGRTFKVYAYSTDGQEEEVYGWETVEVRSKCTGVYITAQSTSAGYAGGATMKNGKVTGVQLFSVDLPNTSGTENKLTLKAMSYGTSAYISWESSNPNVVSVSNGTLTAHKAGTATITLKAMDGSNKKATCKVTVTNPVSSMSIDTSSAQMTNYCPYIAFGKSAKNTVVFADTYGKPSNQKVTWDFTVAEYDSSGYYIRDLTSAVKSAKLITINSSGNLTVKKGLQDYWLNIGGELFVTVTARATDGTGVTASMEYALIRATSRMYMDSGHKSVWGYANKQYYVYFYADQWNLFRDEWWNAFSATSNAPSVASVVEIVPAGDGWYALVFATGNVTKTSSAKITIKANDGSNKSCSFNLKVYP